MGHFVEFKCRFCNYGESQIGVGHGRTESPSLKLFTCENCSSVGSTWVYPDRPPLCSVCYGDGIRLLADDVRRVTCPRCGETARITPTDGEWL